MKKKLTAKNGRGKVIAATALAGAAALALAIWGAMAAFDHLKATYSRQCCVTDAGEQVEVITGKIIPARVIISHFGLTNGVNLSAVPFADLLERMMSATRLNASAPQQHLVGIKAIIHRESTFPLSNAGKLVQKALAFIDRNASRKIGVSDVVAHLRVSRSLANLRFRELQRETIHETITRVRLEEVRRRLSSTRDTIEKISTDCGWASRNTLKNLFKRTFGCSMRDFRSSRLPHHSHRT